LKLKTSDFRTITRRVTPDRPPVDADEIAGFALGLLEEFFRDEAARFRLLGVGLSNFPDPEHDDPQSALFDFGPADDGATSETG
jgi:DNA polymerase-4